jgi:hypothetical protein
MKQVQASIFMSQCKFRLGELPDLKDDDVIVHKATTGKVEVEKTEDTKGSTHEVKCKYRKSCYETGLSELSICGLTNFYTGELPEIHHDVFAAHHTHTEHSNADEESPSKGSSAEVKCKYRKSCYETGKSRTH